MSFKKSVTALALAAPLALLAQAAPILTAPAEAEGIDGSQNLLCFAANLSQCENDGRCEPVMAEDLDLPKFFRLDFSAMTVSRKTGEDSERSSKILNMSTSEDGLLLQGLEEGMGWTLSVEPGGDMSLSATRAGVAFVVFGACTAN
jgi:hypothetical protein